MFFRATSPYQPELQWSGISDQATFFRTKCQYSETYVRTTKHSETNYVSTHEPESKNGQSRNGKNSNSNVTNLVKFECKKCYSDFDHLHQLEKHIASVHEEKKPFKCEMCNNSESLCASATNLNKFECKKCNFSPLVHEEKNPFKCEKCVQNEKLNLHIASVHGREYPPLGHEGKKPFNHQFKCLKMVHEKRILRIASLNIGRGLFKKEELLVNTISEQNCDICSVSEVDIEDFDEKKPFSIRGYNTYFPLKREGTNKRRLLCFVKDGIDVKQRDDLMSDTLSSVWIEVKGINQKILVCTIYREFNDMTRKVPMNLHQQIEKIKILQSQIEVASKEGLALVIGDMNIDINKLEDPSYYQKKIAEEYLSMVGECGLEIINFGITWSRTHQDGNMLNSALDHALINKPTSVNDHYRIDIDYSDHSMICMDLNIEVPKLDNKIINSRDYRRIRANPKILLMELANIKWELMKDMENVDQMETFWTQQINNSLNLVAPWTTRLLKPKKYCLPMAVKTEIKKRKALQKRYQMRVKCGEEDSELEAQFKKQRNYCNKLIKQAVREKEGKNITNVSTVKEIWNSIQGILKPESLNRNTIKIQTEEKLIEDPLEVAESFNVYFKEKIGNLTSKLKKDPNTDPFLLLKEKLKDSKLSFRLRTVSEKQVMKILKSLKHKKSYGCDGITSEVLKLGADVLIVPLTYMINYSILKGRFPSKWKLSKVVPVLKKGDKKVMKNYRPVSLLPVAGMILEKIVAIQIEEYFEKNELLGKFQFGFRRNKSTTSELLTLFDTLLEAKERKKEIMVLLYDLSSAFDTVCHQILLDKLYIYGFDDLSIQWMESYLSNRKQMVEISGKVSTTQELTTRTPQGSRLSPLLFIILIADMDLWAGESIISNFADDTQTIHISENIESLLETTRKDANNVIKFFECNNLVNNADKAALLFNSKGKGKCITIEDIGGEKVESIQSENLLGLHINSNFDWCAHVEKISIDLKKRIGLLRRIKHRVPKEKLLMIAEAIFNSKIRYGCSVYLNPVFDQEELKMKKLSKNTSSLQVLQNSMLRIVFGYKINQHINMEQLRKKIRMFSINQMCIYHTLLEAYNVTRYSSSECIKRKWENKNQNEYSLRSKTTNDLIIPEKPVTKCSGFSYNGAKLFNKLPENIRKTSSPSTFKALIKTWIWQHIPSC